MPTPQFRVFAPEAVVPDSSVPRSACDHSPAVLAQAMQTLVGQLHGLPDFGTKDGLKECHRRKGQVGLVLLHNSFAALAQDVHLSAAAHIQMGIIARDELLAEHLDGYPDLTDSIAEALRSPCDFRIIAGLTLMVRMLPSANFGRLRELSSDVIPLVQGLIIDSKIEDIVLELALDVWEQWAISIQYDEDSGPLLVAAMVRLAAASGDTDRRQIASQILHGLQRVTSATAVLCKHPEIAGPIRQFFMAALRYDSAGDRLAALRGLYHAFPEDDGIAGYPIMHMTASDYTCITGETRFYELDTTRSDAKHIVDLRAEFVDCMRAFCASRDFHVLADQLHELLLRDPRSVDFSPRSIRLFADGRSPPDLQLPFTSWSDTLQHCCDALRTCSLTGCSTNNHRQGANILELQRLILQRNTGDAVTMASKLVKKRDLSVLWYWYALCQEVDGGSIYFVVEALEGLRNAESQSPLVLTPLYQCLMAAIALSTLSYVLSSNFGSQLCNEWKELAEVGPVASWAASEYLRCAPFDGEYTAAMNTVYLMFHIWRHGTSSARNPTPAMRFNHEARWRASTTVNARIWGRPVSSRLHRVPEALYAEYADAVSAYSRVLDLHLSTTPPPARTDDPDGLGRGDLYTGNRKFSSEGLAAWRAIIHDDTRGHLVCWRDAPSMLLPEIMQVGPKVRMRACEYCDVRTVLLRRCGACKRGRYCSENCQAKAWRESHKRVCPRIYR